MKLYPELIECSDVSVIVDTFVKTSKSATSDVVSTLNFAWDNNKESSAEGFYHRVQKAALMCSKMEPDVEDVVAMLLYKDNLNNKAGLKAFETIFRDNRAKRYFDWTVEATRKAPLSENKSTDESIEYYITMRVCDKMYESMMRVMNKKGIPDAVCISKAYELAYDAHYNSPVRQSGEPYLVHPICVARILANEGVESAIVAAALLHDVAEDTFENSTVAKKAIKEKCGARVAQLVEAVTSVDRELEESQIIEDHQTDKAERDELTVKKLAAMVSSDPFMVFALYIKAADRIHNLQTIDIMSSEKKHKKIDETVSAYLPLFKMYNLNYFVAIIEDLLWRTSGPERYEAIKASYLDMVEKNTDFIEEMERTLKNHLGEEFNRECRNMLDIQGYDVEVSRRLYLPNEVYNFVKNAIGQTVVDAKQVDKKVVPVCDINILLDSRDKSGAVDSFVTMFVKMFSKYFNETGRTIIDFSTDKYNRFIIMVEDGYRNKFRCCISMIDDYLSYKFGSGSAVYVNESIDESDENAPETINVALRNGKIVVLPRGATVLDVAFAIHEEVGLAAHYALINDQKASIYSIVQDGDKVVVVSDTYRENGVTKMCDRHARISWLDSVVTKKARKRLIKYLSDKYGEGDNPRYMEPVHDKDADVVGEQNSAPFIERFKNKNA